METVVIVLVGKYVACANYANSRNLKPKEWVPIKSRDDLIKIYGLELKEMVLLSDHEFLKPEDIEIIKSRIR